MDPAIHPRYRRLFRNALHADLVFHDEAAYARIVRDELNVLATNSPTNLPAPRRLYAALDRIAIDVLLLALWGVRPDSDAASLLRKAFGRLGPDGRVAHVGPAQVAAFADLRRLLRDIVDAGASEHSMLGRLLAAEPASARDETAMGNAIYMVERGRHDLRDLLRWIVKYLGDDPAIVAKLRAPNADPDLVQACVLETLRLDQAELLGRKALSTFTFDGFRFPRGSWVSILIRESHRDPGVFDDPDAFRPQRFLGRRYSSDQYAPFGIDEHQCLGASLVVRLSAIFVAELTRGFDWTVIADGPRRHGELHWEPSPSFAIELRPRA
jgi:cytochrome P450